MAAGFGIRSRCLRPGPLLCSSHRRGLVEALAGRCVSELVQAAREGCRVRNRHDCYLVPALTNGLSIFRDRRCLWRGGLSCGCRGRRLRGGTSCNGGRPTSARPSWKKPRCAASCGAEWNIAPGASPRLSSLRFISPECITAITSGAPNRRGRLPQLSHNRLSVGLATLAQRHQHRQHHRPLHRQSVGQSIRNHCLGVHRVSAGYGPTRGTSWRLARHTHPTSTMR